MAIKALLFVLTICLCAYAEDSFYISARYAHDWRNMNLSGEKWSYGGGAAGVTSPSGNILVSPGMSYTHDVPGGSETNEINSAALALGVDLTRKFNLPLRFEVEGSFPATINISYDEVYGEFGSGNNTEIPRIENFGAQQFLQIQYFSFMLNGYFDLHNSTPFVPYAGVGIGAARYSAELSTEVSIEYREETARPGINVGSAARPKKFEKTPDGWLLSLSLTAGVAYKFTDSVTVEAAYRYIYIEDINFKPSINGAYSENAPLIIETTEQKLSSGIHQFILGMRFVL
jgi:opacity protein-like surface antigen